MAKRGTGQGGLETLILQAGSTSAEVYQYGAHISSFRTPSREVLFVSSRSKFEIGTAIRGGIPVLFPQFSDSGPLVKHGFARILPWGIAGEKKDAVTLRLTASDETRKHWPHNFDFFLKIKVSEDADHSYLDTEMEITNRNDKESFTFPLDCTDISLYKT